MTQRKVMPDVISRTEDRLRQAELSAKNGGLADLVQSARHQDRKPKGTPPGYFPQVESQEGDRAASTRIKRRKATVTRNQVVNMRLSADERDRFYSFCEDLNLSLPDGLMHLLNERFKIKHDD